MVYRITLLLATLIPLGCGAPPVETVPLSEEVADPALSAPVDVVRDEQGIPHIYGERLPDVAFAQGYMMALDRFVQMDLARRSASGTLSELAGDLSESLIDRDIRMRLHHLYASAEQILADMRASSDRDDQLLVRALEKFAAGVNAYIRDLQDGRWSLPPALAFAYDYTTIAPWREADSIVLGLLIVFNLSFDGDADIARSELDALAEARFDLAADPQRQARKGIGRDLQLMEPVDPTFTLAGGFSALQPLQRRAALQDLPLLSAARAALAGLGHDRTAAPSHGSNNWVVGPQLTASGRAIVANDPHLALDNPATFYLVHVTARGDDVNVSGAQFPGAPGVILGHNARLAWAATTSNLDVTDVYRETIVPCDGGGGPCVVFQGGKVALEPRTEVIRVGRFGTILRSVEVTLWDVPHHGPIVPRLTAQHQPEPLGGSELSIKWTGHQTFPVLRAVLGLDRARSVKEGMRAIEQHFRVGGQNWVFGDDQGHIGWSAAIRLPRRPAGTVAWKVLPGDGSAEWGADLELDKLPHAYDPPEGFLATANADPIGVTEDGQPWDGDLYIGSDFDPGMRVGRIIKQIKELSVQRKLTLEDLQAIQNDNVSEWDRRFQPTYLEAARAVAEEIAQPGKHADLQPIVAVASPASKALVERALEEVSAWGFDTPEDSRAATIFNVWLNRFARLALQDELEVLGRGVGDSALLRLLHRMCTAPQTLATGLSPTGDALLFDNLTTGPVESKRVQAAKALLEALDYLVPALGPDPTSWTWGRLHTLVLDPILPLDALRIPRKDDPEFKDGFPRQGGNGTVDVGHHGLKVDSYGYGSGPVIRAVYEMNPGAPRVRTVLPGGEVFDPGSAHYRDLLELWRKNQTFDEPFAEADVAASARREHAARGLGRIRFRPR